MVVVGLAVALELGMLIGSNMLRMPGEASAPAPTVTRALAILPPSATATRSRASTPTSTATRSPTATATPTLTPTLAPTAVPTSTPLPQVSRKALTFTVEAGRAHAEGLRLQQGAQLVCSFKVEQNDVGFTFLMTNPVRQVLHQIDRARGDNSFSWMAAQTGEYVLEFDNSYSRITAKTISLSYSITEP
jgi:hypothetical protein